MPASSIEQEKGNDIIENKIAIIDYCRSFHPVILFSPGAGGTVLRCFPKSCAGPEKRKGPYNT